MTAVPVERATTLSDRVAEEILVLLTRRRMSQRRLAEALGVSPSWLNYRLTGVQAIDLNDMQRIADTLGVTITDLLPEDLRPGQVRYQPNDRLPAIEKTAGRRNPKRRPERTTKRREPAPTRPASTIPPSQRRPCPVRPGDRRMAT